jgi:fructokinase
MSAIVVVGEALIDLLVAPDRTISARPGGGPFNTARTLGRLGLQVAFVGRLSTDRFGRQLRGALDADGVSLAVATTTDAPTTLAVAELDERGDADYRFYVDGTSAPGLAIDDVRAALASLGSPPVALYVGTLGLVLEPLGSAVEAAVRAAPDDTLVMLDPNARPSATVDAEAYRERVHRLAERVDVIKASDDDLRFLAPDAAPEVTIDRLLDRGVRVVLRTDGPQDVTVHRAAVDMRRVPAPSVDIVDTVGAGDAFGGGFLAAWVGAGRRRKDLADEAAVLAAVEVAARVAALTCTRPGAEPPTRDELDRATP